jgi:superfamily II DNA or RNA helicase
MMKKKLALLLISKNNLGHVFVPYVIEQRDGEPFFRADDFITESNLNKAVPAEMREVAGQLLAVTSRYDETTLLKLFSKNELNPKKFLDNLSGSLLMQAVLPHVYKYIAQAAQIACQNGVEVYIRHNRSNIYQEDRLKIMPGSAEVEFHFSKNESSLKYGLKLAYSGKSIKLQGKENIVICVNPCLALIGRNIYFVKDVEGNKLAPFFSKEFIEVPAHLYKQYFKTFVLNIIKKYSVTADGFTIENLRPEPEVFLSIETDLMQQECFMLYFKYHSKKYEYSSKLMSQVISQSDENDEISYAKVFRNLAKERKILDMLSGLGLSEDRSGFLKASGSALEWISENRSLLELHGISLSSSNGTAIDISPAAISLKMSGSKDWFDLHATVLFGEIEIPFSDIKKYIISGQESFLLPNGKLGVIPRAWFANYAPIARLGAENGDSLRISGFLASAFASGEKIEYADEETYRKISSISGAETENYALPEGLCAQLRPYQEQGYQWLRSLCKRTLGGCLADDMGLGKTLQALAAVQAARNESILNGQQAATLIVAPASLIHNWKSEIEKFLPHCTAMVYCAKNKKAENAFSSFDFVITTYGMLRNNIADFECYRFLYAVLDESHSIKNPLSKTYRTILKIEASHKLAISGTPIENSLNDLWAQMNFLNDKMLGNHTFFKRNFIEPIAQGAEAERNILKKMVSPFLLRRTKQEVAPDLPEIMKQYVYSEMEAAQAELYETEKSKIRNLIAEAELTGTKSKTSIFVLQSLMALRQIACHPQLFSSSWNGGSAKFDTVCQHLHTAVAEGHKILVFSSFVKQLDIYRSYLDDEGIGYSYLTGSTTDRKYAVDCFQKEDSCKVFLISLKAGGAGLNLTAADYVFMLDPWWNPAAEEQAIARAHRIGQDKPVFVYRFVTKDTIEEKIRLLQTEKAELADAFVNENSEAFDMSEIMEMLG